MCTPAITIVNQLTTARKNTIAPSSPPSPPALRFRSRDAKPMVVPPTRIRWGIARISRNAVVKRFRPVSDGCTSTDTGYGMVATSYVRLPASFSLLPSFFFLLFSGMPRQLEGHAGVLVHAIVRGGEGHGKRRSLAGLAGQRD